MLFYTAKKVWGTCLNVTNLRRSLSLNTDTTLGLWSWSGQLSRVQLSTDTTLGLWSWSGPLSRVRLLVAWCPPCPSCVNCVLCLNCKSVMNEWLKKWSGVHCTRIMTHKTRSKTCPIAIQSTPNSTWNVLKKNPGLRGGRPATNHLRHGTDSSFN
jgi:hypothetical protein